MTDICLLLRIGDRLSNNLRKILFTMAHYMIDIEAKYLPFEGLDGNFNASMVTDFKTGCQEGITGMIFRAYIEYPDGRSTEATFLVNYREDWREACVERFEPVETPNLSDNLPEYWWN